MYFQIGHLMPIAIKVNAYCTIPQVYPCIPRAQSHPYHSIELEYFAIQSLSESCIAEVRSSIIFQLFIGFLITFLSQKAGNHDAAKENDLLEADIEFLTGEIKYCIQT